jgi:two-component system phosphate regulon sensor histidine kinase PhoR
MAEGVVVADAHRVIVLANPAASVIVGAQDGLVAKTIDDAIVDAALREVVARGESAAETRESEVETADGKSIALYVRPLAQSAGGGSVTVLRDMTRIRRLMTMRRDFVANVSHELRTPVAAIQGYAETLLGTGTDAATQKQFLEIVHRQAQRIGALVSDLLTLSELEARPGDEAVREPVDLSALATHVVETVRARATAQESRVAIDVGRDARAMGDPAAVEQILQNLVDNAIKYGRRGGQVRVSGVRNGARVVVTVSDDGPGIAAEHLPRLFERFYRVDAGRSRERGGTGLGLAIVKHLVESMGGTITVESEVDRGTTFRVDLPRA